MKPGIFYLYEYNNSQKLRNAGFLKITRYYRSCTLMRSEERRVGKECGS